MESSRLLWFCGGGEGSVHVVSRCSKGAWLATFADPFNNTIYRQSSIAMRAAITKIPHLLCEKTYLKTPFISLNDTRKAQGLEVLWGGERSGHASSISSKGAFLVTFADPFNNTIYRQSSITMRAVTTKISRLLREKTYLNSLPNALVDVYVWRRVSPLCREYNTY